MLLIGIHWIFHSLVSLSFLMCYAQCCHGNGSGVRHVHIKYHGHLLYYQATVLAIVIYCLRHLLLPWRPTVVMGDMCVLIARGYSLSSFIVTMAMVVMGGMCTKYHGHTYYYQQLIGCYVGNGAL